MNYETCVLCGESTAQVSVGLIEWKVPIGRDRYTAAPRCKDKSACRTRVEALGDPWEVQESEPPPTRELIR